MSHHGLIRCYTLILEKLHRKQYPSFKEIVNHLHKYGFEVSPRTAQRYIEQIRDDFGIEIKYNRFKNGYYIDYEESINVDSFFKFLELANTAALFTESLSESKQTLQYISFDSSSGLKGLELLKPILKAIKEHRKISFTHFNFHTNKRKNYTINPYLLKEYQNRWYVIGVKNQSKEIRTFGIDRIENLEVTTEFFTVDKTINPQEKFDNTIGLIYSNNSLQEVILSFTPTQGKYIKTLPLHNSQKILIDNDQELRVSIHVIPNFELIQLILSHANTVKVIKPKRLADDIKSYLEKTLKKYS